MAAYRKTLSGILFFAWYFLSAQLTFTEIPGDLQLIPRSSTSGGSFRVSGKNSYPNYDRIRGQLVLNSDYSQVIEDTLVNINADSTFSMKLDIPARLAEYDLIISLVDSVEEFPIKAVSRLVCGDFFIICGQSNAMAPADYSDTAYVRPWLRGIGSHDNPNDSTFPCAPQSLKFAQANPAWLQAGFVGTWGMKLQYDLSVYTGIPTCFINGARAGSSLQQNLASCTPSHLDKIDSCNAYDRLYQKVAHYGLNPFIRALFWYQGETDGSFQLDSTCNYMDQFQRLYASWKADYPNLEKIFMMQVNAGCTISNLSVLREIQRKISYKYKDIIILSTFSTDTADRASDNCHYTFQGYNKLANIILPVVKKYIYGAALEDDKILPPKILKAYVSQPRQLCLEFDEEITVQQFKQYQQQAVYIKDYFYGEGQADLHLLSVTSDSNKVLLNFPEGAVLPSEITYLSPSVTKIPTLYTGPYILNKQNPDLTALSFCDFPVTAQSSNGWAKDWTNFGNGQLDTCEIHADDIFYTGNFTGDAAEELLYISNNATPSAASLFSYQTDNWLRLWSGNSFADKSIYNYRDKLIAGDFDGDGSDELFANGDVSTGGAACLFKFVNNAWLMVWTDHGDVNHPVYAFRHRLYAGDFDGDGSNELIGFDAASPGSAVIIVYRNSDFMLAGWKSYPGHKLIPYRDHLVPGDYDGDGKTDLLGFFENSSTLFIYRNNNWDCVWNNNAGSNIGNFNYSTTGDKIIAGEVNGEPGDELLLIGKSRMAIMNFKEGNNWNYNWSVSATSVFPASVSDWRFDMPGNTNVAYCLVSTKIQQPARLLAMRKEDCGYVASLYRTDSLPYNHSTGSNTNNGCGRLLLPEKDFLLYPSPAKDVVTVELYEQDLHNTISLIDSQGKLMLQLKDQNKRITELSVKNYERGFYLIKVDNAQGSLVKKMILE